MNASVLDRRTVVSEVLKYRGDAAIVTGLGSPAYDSFAAGDSDLNFYLWGAMGGAAMIGLGVALTQPGRRVLVITGDGEMMMGIGSLATIAAQNPSNLSLLVLDNEAFGETGRQRGLTAGPANIEQMARGAGIARTLTIQTETELDGLGVTLFHEEGPTLCVAKVALTDDPVSLPPRDGGYLCDRFRGALTR